MDVNEALDIFGEEMAVDIPPRQAVNTFGGFEEGRAECGLDSSQWRPANTVMAQVPVIRHGR